MIRYADIDARKDAFVFELDDVLYPAKDYWYQVYYLFASFLEYTEMIDAKEATNNMTGTYSSEGKEHVFDNLKKKLNLDEKYRANFNHLSNTAKLPLKLLLFRSMLELLQEVVMDRKKIFIVTNGNPGQQLNKIKQVEWNGLEPYLTCYFANELVPKPETDCIDLLIKEHNLQRRNIVMIGADDTDEQCAEASGIDFIKLTGL
ncbi:HAD family hydrolase [Mucilaginibacter sp.]|jgi:FMN phosphatase YigB (HAD superfamily)|uniref:HAD family hydrolase n=1 Tax=Mucilaginibacter sp. TaxID=1882438 RepID=UPI002CE4BE2B|nr:HAD hydrolase-like protein [Mucilaginibacter sp.]HTI59397.1 HAD hydrolase-like protein [Mucilaginibacter sp.]